MYRIDVHFFCQRAIKHATYLEQQMNLIEIAGIPVYHENNTWSLDNDVVYVIKPALRTAYVLMNDATRISAHATLESAIVAGESYLDSLYN